MLRQGNLNYTLRDRLSLGFGLATSVAMVLLFTFRLGGNNPIHPSAYLILGFGLGALALCFYKYKKPESQILSHFLVIVGSLVMAYRITITGGITSPGAVWITIVPLGAGILLSLRSAILYSSFFYGSLLFLIYGGFVSTQPSLEFSRELGLFNYFLALVLMLFFIHFYRKQVQNIIGDLRNTNENLKDTQDELIKTQQIKTINRIIDDLNQEINNPLFIALANLQRFKKNPDPKNLFKLEKSLNRVKALTEKIGQTAREEVDKRNP